MNTLDELIDWSKREIEKEDLKPELLNCRSVISLILDMYDDLIDAKRINIKLGQVNQPIVVDSGIYTFMVRNALFSAIELTPQNGTISIETSETDDYVNTIIHDSGDGFEQTEIEELMEDQELPPTSTEDIGIGLNLRTARKYTDLLNGIFKIESDPGNGTEIFMGLPKFG